MYGALNGPTRGGVATALNNLPGGERSFNSFDDLFHGNGGVRDTALNSLPPPLPSSGNRVERRNSRNLGEILGVHSDSVAPQVCQ